MQLLRGPWSNAVVELPCWGTAWNSCFILLPPHGLWSWEPTGQGPAVLPGWKLLLLSHSLLPWDHPELTWMDLHHGVTPDPPWRKGHELWLLHFPFAWKGLSAAREKHQTEKRRAACGFGEGHFPVSSNRHLPKEPNPNTFAGLFTAPEFLLFQSEHDPAMAGVASFICSEHGAGQHCCLHPFNHFMPSWWVFGAPFHPPECPHAPADHRNCALACRDWTPLTKWHPVWWQTEKQSFYILSYFSFFFFKKHFS